VIPSDGDRPAFKVTLLDLQAPGAAAAA